MQARFGDKLKPINEGVAREGAFYLFALRLVPAFPFFAINLLMGLTPIRTLDLLLGQPARHARGHHRLRVRRHPARASFRHLASACSLAFALLGLFPLVAKKLARCASRRARVYARWRRPARFDRNLVVIGAGSAGLVSAYIAAAVKAKVTLVEKHRMGGDCLNTGCVPSKALIRTRSLLAQIAARAGVRHPVARAPSSTSPR